VRGREGGVGVCWGWVEVDEVLSGWIASCRARSTFPLVWELNVSFGVLLYAGRVANGAVFVCVCVSVCECV